jgi:hypothetical protein
MYKIHFPDKGRPIEINDVTAWVFAAGVALAGGSATIEDTLTGLAFTITPAHEHEDGDDTLLQSYKVVFRNSTIVDERRIRTADILTAAHRAEAMTSDGGDFEGWDVYSITMGY